jgi:hypothetical protein
MPLAKRVQQRHNKSSLSSGDGREHNSMADAAGVPERTIYEVGAGRKTALSLAFLILLPFYASLPAMLARRLVHGLWFDTIGLIVFSALFTGLMALLGVQLYLSLRSRVELGETALRISLPQGGSATPLLHFLVKEIPYDKIAAVETRSVLFGNAMAPVLLRATRLALENGEHVRLGNVNEDNVDAALPFPEIGAKIANRAGVDVVDAGTVRRAIDKPVLRLFGRKTPPEASPPLTEVEVAELNSRHARAMKYLVAGMALLVVAGIAIDVFTAPRASYATIGGAAPPGKR